MITNYLSPVSFVAVIERLPNVEFFTQRFTIPSVSATPPVQVSPIHNIYKTPDRLEYSDLDLSFIIDEHMNNYQEILRWMEGIGTPESTDQFDTLQRGKFGITSDITVIVKNSARNPEKKFTFTECFPTSLSPVQLDVTGSDVIYPECVVTFRYTNMKMENIS
jgi:hypothetical protein